MEVGLNNSWGGQSRIWPLVISVIVVYYFFRPMSTQLSIIIFFSSFSISKMVIKENKNNWLLTRPCLRPVISGSQAGFGRISAEIVSAVMHFWGRGGGATQQGGPSLLPSSPPLPSVPQFLPPPPSMPPIFLLLLWRLCSAELKVCETT